MARRNDKRDRLIDAADNLFHQQGVSVTTLANIASLANVPLGNVYYYFKSKDSIILAVIDRRQKQLNNLFAEWNLLADPNARITAFIDYFASLSEEAAKFGDALGSLCQELGKLGGAISEASATLMKTIIDWCEAQFNELGRNDSTSLAINLVSSLQGICLITLTFKDPAFIARQRQFLLQSLNIEAQQESAAAFA